MPCRRTRVQRTVALSLAEVMPGIMHAVVSKRNMASMTKHRVNIMKSSGPEGVGNGAFTTSDMSAGTTLLVKGIWFIDMDQVNTWLNQQHPLTGQAMSRNIVEVHFSTPPRGANITYYFVMTGLAGYVNAYTLTDRWGSTVGRCT